jgi:lysophospholipase L1-like esterase
MQTRLWDCLHVNDTGYRFIADAFAKAIDD